MRKKWAKRLIALTAVLCALMVIQLLAGAAGDWTEVTAGSLLVNACNYEGPDMADMAKDLQEADIVMDLYRVAGMERISGSTGYTFEPLEPYSLEIDPETDGETWRQLAQTAAETALLGSGPLSPDAFTAAGQKLEELPLGLYLVIPHTRDDQDYVRQIPVENGETRIVAQVKTAEHSYRFLPELVALPGEPVEGSEDGAWNYDVEVNLKPEMDTGFGSVEIIKTLLQYESSRPATFVFEITGVKDGEVVYDNFVSLTFTAPGQQSTLVERVPVGTLIEVKEVDSGTSYKLVSSSAPESNLLKADETLQFTFENDYTGGGGGGHGIRNHFSYNAEVGEWQWSTPDGGTGGESE